MAQITYADKTALYQNADVAAENKVRDIDMNEIKQVVNDNETKILLDVTDTAPAECSTGDMYFDTTDDLIYTATATDTWGSTGVAPTSNTLYVVLTTQTSYMYDGNTLISVGGGGGGIAVYPDEPEEDTKLYIEEEDLDFQGLEIANEYTIGDNVAYSVDYSNSAFGGTILWTNPSPTSAFAGQVVQVDLSDCDMYEILFMTSKEDTNCQSSGKIPKTFTTILNYSIGNASNGPYNMYRNISAISNTSITFTDSQVAYASTRTVSGDNCIPLYIIGYKTGLFN